MTVMIFYLMSTLFITIEFGKLLNPNLYIRIIRSFKSKAQKTLKNINDGDILRMDYEFQPIEIRVATIKVIFSAWLLVGGIIAAFGIINDTFILLAGIMAGISIDSYKPSVIRAIAVLNICIMLFGVYNEVVLKMNYVSLIDMTISSLF